MDFAAYQNDVVQLTDRNELAHEVLPLLGLGGHVGELLHTHQRYLSESLVAETSRDLVARELGTVVRSAALLAHLNGLSLAHIAHANLVKVDARARAKEMPGIDELPPYDEPLQADTYQALAAQTDEAISAGIDPLGLSVPMLGLAGEAGSLLLEQKKRFRRDHELKDWPGFLSIELGDLLWYVATVSRHLSMTLGEVMGADVLRLAKLASLAGPGGEATSLDADFPDTERFPRQLHLHFEERLVEGTATVTMTLLDATPNAFPNGPVPRGDDKVQGFTLNARLGDEVDDNSRRADDYRFHDAIHLGFLAVLGWSPNLRGLLKLKRKSDDVVDNADDGARAVFAEEGVAAILAKQAAASKDFANPNLVPERLLDLIDTVVEDLEVADLPYRMWRDAISQGFAVMGQLAEAGGGYVFADLDSRTLQYSKFPFKKPTARLG